MNKKYSIRQITVEDYAYINKWYKQIGIHQPKSSILPNNGLDGFVIEKNKRLLAAFYLYLTNSKMGYFDFLISDPNYKGKDRFDIIQILLDECVRRAHALGCSFIWCTSTERGVLERCKKSGFHVVEPKENIIIKVLSNVR